MSVDHPSPIAEWMNAPAIRELLELTKKNAALAECMSASVAQRFLHAADLEAAFQGALPHNSPEDVEREMTTILQNLHHRRQLEEAGVTRDDLKRILEIPWIYARFSHPHLKLAEAVLSKMEGTEDTAVFGTGLGATRAAFELLSRPARSGEGGEYIAGDKIVAVGSVYGGTFAQLQNFLTRETGRRAEFITLKDFLEGKCPQDAALIYFESCSNPTMEVMPIPEIVGRAQKIGAKTVCDNTFTPLTVQPAMHGVDLVVHSMSKYIGGHSEDLGGSLSGKASLIGHVYGTEAGERMVGANPMMPRVALAFLKNMTDLPHRLHGATQQARVLKAVFKTYGLEAVSIDDSPVYSRLRTPGLPHTMSNGMLCIDFGSREQAYLFTDTMAAKNVGRLCVSLGSVNTYYCPPAQTTHSEIPPKEQLKVGIKPGLVRISCGLESNLIPTVSGVLRDMGYMHVSP